MDWLTLTSDKTVAGSIAQWINDSRIQSSTATIIQEAEAIIYRTLRHWRMMQPPTIGTMTVGTDAIPLPSDLLEPNFLMIIPSATVTARRIIPLITMQEILRSWQFDGSGNRVQTMPRAYYFNAVNIQFDAPPDQAYSYAFMYYQQPAALSTTNTTNFLTQYYPRLFRCAVMMEACEWIKDSGQGGNSKDYWEQQYSAEIAKAQQESDRAHRAIEAGPILYDSNISNSGFGYGAGYP